MSLYFKTVQQLGFTHSTNQQKGKGRISSLSSISKQLFKAHYDGYQARMSRQLATALKRYINTRPKHERKTPEFIDEVRKKIFCLHEYNLEIAKVKFKYPRSEQFDAVLIQYVNLECEFLYGTYTEVDKERENNVTQRVIRLLRVILYDALQNNEVPLKTTAAACDKALLKLITSVRTDFISENKLVAYTVIKLLQKLNLLDDINKLKGKNVAFQQDTFLRNPLVCTIRQSLATSDYESDMDDDDDDDDMISLGDDIFTSRRQQSSFSQKDEKAKLKRTLKNSPSNLDFRKHSPSSCPPQNRPSDSYMGNQKENTGERSNEIIQTSVNNFQEKRSNFSLIGTGVKTENSNNNLITSDRRTSVDKDVGAFTIETNKSAATIINQSPARVESVVILTNGTPMEEDCIDFSKNGTEPGKEMIPDNLTATSQEIFDAVKVNPKSTCNFENSHSMSSRSDFFRAEPSRFKENTSINDTKRLGVTELTEVLSEPTSESISNVKRSDIPVTTSLEQSEVIEIIDDLNESNHISENDQQIILKTEVPDLVDAMESMATIEPSGSDTFGTNTRSLPDNSTKNKIHHTETIDAGVITIEILDDDDDNNYMGFSLSGNEGQSQSNLSNPFNHLLQSNEIKLEENEENRSPNFSVPVSDDNNQQVTNSGKNLKNSDSTGLNKLENNSSKDSAKDADLTDIVISDSEDEVLRSSSNRDDELLNTSDDVLNEINDALKEMNAVDNNNKLLAGSEITGEAENTHIEKDAEIEPKVSSVDFDDNLKEIATKSPVAFENIVNVDDQRDKEKEDCDQDSENTRDAETNKNCEEDSAISINETCIQCSAIENADDDQILAKIDTRKIDIKLGVEDQEAEKETEDEDHLEEEGNEIIDDSIDNGACKEMDDTISTVQVAEISSDVTSSAEKTNVVESGKTSENLDQEIDVASITELSANCENNVIVENDIVAHENEYCFQADTAVENVAYETEIVSTNLQSQPELSQKELHGVGNEVEAQVKSLDKSDELQAKNFPTTQAIINESETEKQVVETDEKTNSDEASLVSETIVEESAKIASCDFEPSDENSHDKGIVMDEKPTDEIHVCELASSQVLEDDVYPNEDENHQDEDLRRSTYVAEDKECKTVESCTEENIELLEKEDVTVVSESAAEAQCEEETNCEISKNVIDVSSENLPAEDLFDKSNEQSDSFEPETSYETEAEKKMEIVPEEIEQDALYEDVSCLVPVLLQNEEQSHLTETVTYNEHFEEVVTTADNCTTSVPQESSENVCSNNPSATDIECQENFASELSVENSEPNEEVTCEAIDYSVPAQYVVHHPPEGVGYVNETLVYQDQQTSSQVLPESGDMTQSTQDTGDQATPVQTPLLLYSLSSTITEMDYIKYDSEKKGGGDLELLANIAADQETLAVKTDSEKETLDSVSDVEIPIKAEFLQSTPKRKSKLKFEYNKKGVVGEVSPRTIKQLRRTQTLKQVAAIKEVRNKRITRNAAMKMRTAASANEIQTPNRKNDDPKYKPDDFISIENSVFPPRKNNVYAQKRLMETQTTSEDSNDSCENSLFIDLGDNSKSEKIVKPTHEEVPVDNKLGAVSSLCQTRSHVDISGKRSNEFNGSGTNDQRILDRMGDYVGNSGRRSNVPKMKTRQKNKSKTNLKIDVSEKEKTPAKNGKKKKNAVANTSLPGSRAKRTSRQKATKSLSKYCPNETKIVKTTDHSIENILNKSPSSASLNTFRAETEFNKSAAAKSPARDKSDAVRRKSNFQKDVINENLKSSKSVEEMVPHQTKTGKKSPSLEKEKVAKNAISNHEFKKLLCEEENKAQMVPHDFTKDNSGVVIHDENYEKTFKTKASVKSYEDKIQPDSLLRLRKSKSQCESTTGEWGTRIRSRSRGLEPRETRFDRSRSSSADFSPISTNWSFDSTDISETDVTQESDATLTSSVTPEPEERDEFSASTIHRKTDNNTSKLSADLGNLAKNPAEKVDSVHISENTMCIDITTKLNEDVSGTSEKMKDLKSSSLSVGEKNEESGNEEIENVTVPGVGSQELTIEGFANEETKEKELRKEVDDLRNERSLPSDYAVDLHTKTQFVDEEKKGEEMSKVNAEEDTSVLNETVKNIGTPKQSDSEGKEQKVFNEIESLERKANVLNQLIEDLGINKSDHHETKVQPEELIHTATDTPRKDIDISNKLDKNLEMNKQDDHEKEKQDSQRQEANKVENETESSVKDFEKNKLPDGEDEEKMQSKKEEVSVPEKDANVLIDLKITEKFTRNEKMQKKPKKEKIAKLEKDTSASDDLATIKQPVDKEVKMAQETSNDISRDISITSVSSALIIPVLESQIINQEDKQVSASESPKKYPDKNSPEKNNRFSKASDKAKGQTLEDTIKKMKEKIEESEKSKKEPTPLQSKDTEKTVVPLHSPGNSDLQQVNVEQLTIVKDDPEKSQPSKTSSIQPKQLSVEANKKEERKRRRSRSSSKSQSLEKKERTTRKEKSSHKSSRSRSSSKSHSLEKKDKHHSDSDIDKRRRNESTSVDDQSEHKKRRSRSPSRAKSVDGKARGSDRPSKHKSSESKEKSTREHKKDIDKKRNSKSPPKAKPDETNQKLPDKKKNSDKVKTKDKNEDTNKLDVSKSEVENKTTHKESLPIDKAQRNTDKQSKGDRKSDHKVDRKTNRTKSNKQAKVQENHVGKPIGKQEEKIEEKPADKKVVDDGKSKAHDTAKTLESAHHVSDAKIRNEHKIKPKEKNLEGQLQLPQNVEKLNEPSKKIDVSKDANKPVRARSKEKGRFEKDEHKIKLKEKNQESQSQLTQDQKNQSAVSKGHENFKNGKKSTRGHSKEKVKSEKGDDHKNKTKGKNQESTAHPIQEHEKLDVLSKGGDKLKGENKSTQGPSKEKDTLENVSRINKREKAILKDKDVSDFKRTDKCAEEMKSDIPKPNEMEKVKEEQQSDISKPNEMQKVKEQHTIHRFEESVDLVKLDQKTVADTGFNSRKEEVKVSHVDIPKKRKYNESIISSENMSSHDLPQPKIAKIDTENTTSNEYAGEDGPTLTQQMQCTNVINSSEPSSVKDLCVEANFSDENAVLRITNVDDGVSKGNSNEKTSEKPKEDVQITNTILSSKNISSKELLTEITDEKTSTYDKNANCSREVIPGGIAKIDKTVTTSDNLKEDREISTKQLKSAHVIIPSETTSDKEVVTGTVETKTSTSDATDIVSSNIERFKDNSNTPAADISYENGSSGIIKKNSVTPQPKNEEITKRNGVSKAFENDREENKASAPKTWDETSENNNIAALTPNDTTLTAQNHELNQTNSAVNLKHVEVETQHKEEFVGPSNILLQNEFVPISSSEPMCVTVFSSSDIVQNMTALKDSTIKHFSASEADLPFVPTAATSITTSCTTTTTVSMSCDLPTRLTLTSTPPCTESAVREKPCLFAFNEDGETVNRENLNTSDIFHTSLGLEDISPTKLPLASNQSLDLISPSTSIAEIGNRMNLVETLGTSSINFEVPDTSEIDIQQASKQNSFGPNFVTRVTEISCYVEKESTADHNYTLGDPLLGGNHEDKNILTTGLSLSNSPEEFQLNESHLEDLSFNENNFIEENGTLEELGLLLPCKKEKPDFDNIIDDPIPKPEDIQNSIKHLNMLVEQGVQTKTISVDNVIDQHHTTDCSGSLGIDYAVSKLLFLGGNDVTSQNNTFSTIPDIENISIIESSVQPSKHPLEEVSPETNKEEANIIPPLYQSFMSADVNQKVVVEPVEQCTITSMDQLKKDYINETPKVEEKIKPVVEKLKYESGLANQTTYRSSPFATFLESVKREANKTDTSKVKDELENCIARKYNRTPLSTSKKKAQNHTNSPAHKKSDELHSNTTKNNKPQIPPEGSRGGRIRVKTDLINASEASGPVANNSVSSLDIIIEHDQNVASEIVLPFSKPSPSEQKTDIQENRIAEVISKNNSGSTKHARFDKMGNDYIMENILNVCKETSHKSPIQDVKPPKKPDVAEVTNKRKLVPSESEMRKDDKRLKKSDEEVGKGRNVSDNVKSQAKKGDSGIPNPKLTNDDIFDQLVREGPVNKVFAQRMSEQKVKKEIHTPSNNSSSEQKKNREYSTTPDSYRRERTRSSQPTPSHLYDLSKGRDLGKIQKRPGHSSNSSAQIDKRLTEGKHVIPKLETSKRYIKNSGNSYSSKSDPLTTRDYRSRDRRMSTEQPNSLFPKTSRSDTSRKDDDKFSWIDKFSGSGLFDTPSDLFMPPGSKREDTSCRK